MNIALLTAGGRGTRMHNEIPKQFMTVNDKPLIVYTLEAFERHADIDAIAAVCLDGWQDILWAYARQYGITKLRWVTAGGATGQESIRNGLFELEKHCSRDDLVLVHDGNRALVPQDVISDCIATAVRFGSAVAVVPCQEVILESDDGVSSCVKHERSRLKRTQTPHGFRLGTLLDAHRQAEKEGITDTVASCDLLVRLGQKVHFSQGSEKNIKLTTPEDLDIFKALLSLRRQ